MHENPLNIEHAMRNKGLLATDDTSNLVQLFMCSVDSMECAYSEAANAVMPNSDSAGW